MRSGKWPKALALSGIAISTTSFFGPDIQALGLFAACIAAAVCVSVGIRIRKPEQKSPWLWLVATCCLFVTSFSMRIAGLDVGSHGQFIYPTYPDVIDALGYSTTIIAMHRFGRLRRHDKDPTNLVDALMLSGGTGIVIWSTFLFPHVLDADVDLKVRIADTVFSVLSLILLAVVARLAIGPGSKNLSYYCLAGVAVSALLSDLVTALQQAGVNFAGGDFLALALPMSSFLAMSGAALHPTMTEITKPSRSGIGRLTRRRLALVTVATNLPLATLLIEAFFKRSSGYFDFLVLSSIILVILFVVRFAGLVRAQERDADLERSIHEAAATLVTVTDKPELFRSALSSMSDLTVSHVGEVRSSIIMKQENGDWLVVASSGIDAHLSMGHVLDANQTNNLFSFSGELSAATKAEAIDVPKAQQMYCALARLQVKTEMSGALVISSKSSVSSNMRDALIALASMISLSIETAELREDLHRRRSDRRFRSLVENSSEALVVVGDNDQIHFQSPSADRLFDQLTSLNSLLNSFDNASRSQIRNLIGESRLKPGRRGPIEVSIDGEAGGSRRWFEVTAVDMRFEPEVNGVVINAYEITERKLAEVDRDRSFSRFSSLVRRSSDITAVVSSRGVVDYMSPACESVLGFPPEMFVDRLLNDFIHPADQDALSKLLNGPGNRTGDSRPSSLEVRLRTAGQEWKTVDTSISDLRNDPAVNGYVLNAHDVTDRKKLENDLRHKVLHDDLTGIANRVLLRERVTHAILSRRADETTAVLLIDIDDFKTINDGLGHAVGDELLRVLAFRLQSFVRGSDTAARLGGDEFAILIEAVEDIQKVLEITERLNEIIEQPLDFDGREIKVTASCGIAFVDGNATAEELIRNADVAMYSAKRDGKGRIKLFDEAMYNSTIERLELKADLGQALVREELEVFYQPIVSFANFELLGFEALLRWRHPERGYISPVSFIPIAEETGLIVPIGTWVLNSAVSALAAWQEQINDRTLFVSVNLAPRQLEESDIVEIVSGVIDKYHVNSASVILELTESAVVDDAVARERLNSLGQLGVGIAADDFGSGFASYAALQQLPFTAVKIDRSLLLGLSATVGRAEAQLRSIIDMAHATGLKVVAEGIEDASQRDALKAMGCDRAQGFLFGRPVPHADSTELVIEKANKSIRAI